MWQKERLLNLAISSLPRECRKVAWLDCDILFENPLWMIQTSKLLDRYALVQPFQHVAYPRKDELSYSGESSAMVESFASVHRSAPDRYLCGEFRKHGHTGFGWAARRDLLTGHPLYEACVAGDSDHMMAHAACGDWDSACIYKSIMGLVHRNHFRQWAAPFFTDVQGSIGFVPGKILHLWHGEAQNKRMYERLLELAAFEFDPNTDVRVKHGEALEWNSSKPELHRWFQNYFASRMEDGNENHARANRCP
jgi:hypothetical protein